MCDHIILIVVLAFLGLILSLLVCEGLEWWEGRSQK